jgi:hypothetical protein
MARCAVLTDRRKKLKSYRKRLLRRLAGRAGQAHISGRQQETDMADGLNRFLGDTPGRTIVKLIVVSLIVGFVMSVFGLDPMDLLDGIRFFLIDLWYTGFDALGRVGQYLLIGATIVIPAFIVLRLFASRN